MSTSNKNIKFLNFFCYCGSGSGSSWRKAMPIHADLNSQHCQEFTSFVSYIFKWSELEPDPDPKLYWKVESRYGNKSFWIDNTVLILPSLATELGQAFWGKRAEKDEGRKKNYKNKRDIRPVLRIRIRDPVPFWPLDPGSGRGKKSGSGWTTRIIFPKA